VSVVYEAVESDQVENKNLFVK